MSLEKVLTIGKRIALTGLMLSFLLFGCKKDNSDNPHDPSEVVLSSNTRVLTEQNLQEINYFDGNEIKFNASANSPTLNENTFIVGGVSEKTPDGILKKVTGVSGNGYSAQLINATLDDAIESGEMKFTKSLKPSDLENSILKEGVKLKESNLNYDFQYDLFDVIIYDLDGNLNTTNDQVRANGKIYLNTNVELNLDFEKRTASFKSGLETLTRIELDAELTNYNIDEEKLIAEHKFKPIVFFLPSSPPFPIVLRPVFNLYARANGEINAEAHAVVEETNSISASINYNGSWNSSKDFSENFTFENPQTYLNADIETSLGPKLDVLLYGFIGPSLEIAPYLKLHVNTNENPWLNLYGGLEGKIGINSSVIGMGISDYEKNIIDFEKKLLELFNSENKLPHAKFNVNPETGNIGTNFEFDASASFDFEDPPEVLQVRWDWEDDGTWDTQYSYSKLIYHQYSSPGNYPIRLEVKDSQNGTGQTWKCVQVGGGTGSTFIDPRDGQTYQIVKIGDQWWFAENLNYNSSNSYYYNNDPSYSDYGKLYQWNSTNSACPLGWHLPGDEEFKELEMFLGMSQTEANQMGPNRGANQFVGSKLKLGGSSGFNAEMAGHGYPSTFGITFTNFGDIAYFWTSTQNGTSPPFNRILYETNTGVSRDNYILETCYFSTRCVKN